MKIVFMGSPDFAVSSLNLLADGPHQIVGVVTVPDKPAGRGKKMSGSAVKQRAQQLNLPLQQPVDLRAAEFISTLRRWQADLFVVVAFRILPPEVFTLPPAGTINLHASLLPKYRGAAPINWALINGEQETGVTTFFIQEKVDTGNILLQRSLPIGADMIFGELYAILQDAGADLLLETVQGLDSHALVARPQIGMVTSAPKIQSETGQVDWNKSTREIYNLYRGLTPLPGCYTFHAGKRLKLIKISPAREQMPGAMRGGQILDLSAQSSFTVATADGAMRVFALQLEGKKPMSVEEFLRGYTLRAGQVLG